MVQIGLALSLLATSSLFMQALSKMQHADPGFELEGAMSAQVLLPAERYPEPTRARDFYRQLDEALKGLPNNARYGITSNAPLEWDGPWRDFQIAGRKTADREEAPRSRWTSVSTSLLRARSGCRSWPDAASPTPTPTNTQKVAVISKSLADKYFPGGDPLGKRIELSSAAAAWASLTDGTREIVGVVADLRTFSGLQKPLEEPRMYEPLQQQPPSGFFIVVRSSGEPLAAGPVLRQRVKSLDPLLAVAQIRSMRELFENRLWQAHFFSRLMAILGGLSLVLAAVGVFGVVSYSTSRRTREFGIRAALGAEPRQIATLVLRKTLGLAGFGVALGLLLALMLSAVTRVMLYETDARDPATLLGVSLLLVLVTCVAGAVPTLRATRVQPMHSLREE